MPAPKRSDLALGYGGLVDVEVLHELAGLLRGRNALDSQIARVIGRPALPGHLGEWIASRIFDIELAASAVTKGIDGHFRGAPQPGATVNVKLYGTRAGALDLIEESAADYYLVLTGPIAQPVSSRGTHRPVCVNGAYLFHTAELLADLRGRGLRVGVASSVRKTLWEHAELYPQQSNADLVLTEAQRYALQLFRDTSTEAKPVVAPPPDTSSSTSLAERDGRHSVWSELSVGKRRQAALEAMRDALTNHGFKVTAPERARSIVLKAERGGNAIEIHLRSSMGVGPAYWPKSILTPAAHRYGGLALLENDQAPKLYLIPSLDWNRPDGVLVDRTYEAAASSPEWGVNLPGARPALERYAVERTLTQP